MDQRGADMEGADAGRVAAPRFGRRSLLRAGGLATGVAALSGIAAGCSPEGPPNRGGSGGTGSGRGTTVKFWTVTDGPEDEAFQRKMYDKFNSENPDVQIELTVFPPQQFGNALQLAFTGGGADVPDVFRAGNGAKIDDVYNKEWASPLDEFLTDEFKNRFPDYCYRDPDHSPLYRDGNAYTVPRSDPFVHGQRPMYCNVELLEKAGLSAPPSTWSEFAEVAAKITTDGGGKVFGTSVVAASPQQWVMQCFAGPQPYLAYGQPAINLLDGTPMMAHPSMVDTVEFWHKLVAGRVLTIGFESWKPEQAIQHMAAGRLAMYMFPLFHANEIRKTNPDVPMVLAPPPMPDDGRKGSLAQLGDVSQWFMSSRCKVKEAAWRVLDFLGSVEYQRGCLTEVGQDSIIPAVYDGIELSEDTRRKQEMAHELVRNRPEPGYRDQHVRDFYAELASKGPKPLPGAMMFEGMTKGGYRSAAEKYDQQLTRTMEPLLDKHGIDPEVLRYPEWDPLQHWDEG